MAQGRVTAAAQIPLPLDQAPAKVRRHGLRDCHTWPLVSRGKRLDGPFRSFRVPAHCAWEFPSIELRAGNSWPALVLDCDGRDAPERLIVAVQDGRLPETNWIVTRIRSGGLHAVWTLARPVHRGETARKSPLALFARVAERFAYVANADDGYVSVLTHNPMARAHGPGLRTTWGRREPYTLGQLAEIVPLGWRKPAVSRTGVGRNCDLFRAGMKWAGSPVNLGVDVLPALMAANQDLPWPLDHGKSRASPSRLSATAANG